MNSLQLDEIARQIDSSFGEELLMTEQPLNDAEKGVLDGIMQGKAHQEYLQDLVNRQIIRDYLLNAVMLGCISDENFASLSRQATSPEGRSALSLHMIMTSVDAADEIASELPPGGLKALRPVPGAPPHMVIVRR